MTVPMVDGVTQLARGSASVQVPGATGLESAQLTYDLTGLQPGVAYHLIAYCTVGAKDTCVPRNWIPQLVDYVHDLGWATTDAQGRLRASFTIDPLPLGTYGWHVVASWRGFERYPVVTASTHKHVHNQLPH